MVNGMEASVAEVAAWSRPVTTADSRMLGVPAAAADIFTEGGIRRGSTISIASSGGGVSLALAIAGEVTGHGGWAAAVGLPSIGLVAAVELGVRLDRLALVPRPGAQWPVVVAALLDGVDLLLLNPPSRIRPADARRLAARVRERGVVLMLLGGEGWPEPADLRLTVARSEWVGLGTGYGHLRARRGEVMVSGRRAAARERRCWLWLPDRQGRLAPAEPDGGRTRAEPAMVS